MECELNDTKLRVYECGKIEKFGFKSYKSKEETWHELKGTINIKKTGYKRHRTKINKKEYITSRIIYYAYFPDLFDINNPIIEIDHINRDSLDNRINNLRVATRTEQILNRDCVINQKGYYWDKSKNKWMARIRINGKQIYLGYFDTEHEAHQAYLDAKLKYLSV